MARSLAALCLLAVACPRPSAAPPGGGGGPKHGPGVEVGPDGRVVEPPVPTLRLPGGFTPTRYTVALELDPARSTFHGELELDAELAAPASLIWLDAEGLTITAATANGVAAEVVTQPHDFVGIRLAEDALAGPIRLHLSYDGAVATQDTYGVFMQHDQGTPYLFTQLEPLGARMVFPCVDEPWSKVPWTISITAPVDQMAVSNARELSREVLADGLARTTFAETAPLPTYLLAFGVGPFEAVDAGTTSSGAPIRIIAFAGRGEQTAWAAKVTPQIVAILEDWFGTPYPYDKLDSLAIPETVGFGAMENAGLITYRESLLLLDPEDASEDDRRDYVMVAGHEVSHQWFGDLVTPRWWDELWLNEAFATWMEEKVMATFSPAWSLRTPVIVSRSDALDADGLVTARMIRQPIEHADDIGDAFDAITYGKGSSVIRMFERWVGPEAFQAGVRAYLAAHAGGTATTDDFLAALDGASEVDVTAAFRTFLDQAGAPRVTAELTCPTSKKDPTPVSLTLRQERWLPRGSAPPAGDPPRWQIPVCVAYGTVKERHKACTLLAGESTTLPLEGKCPKWVLPNADGIGYYRMGVTQDLLDDLLGAGWSQLRPHERVLLGGDVRAEVARGGLPIGAELDLARKLAKDATWHAIETATEIAADALAVVSDASRPALVEWIDKTFGRRAQKLGFLPDEDEDLDAERMRAALVPLVTEIGRDAKLMARSVELAKKWTKLPEGTRAMVLRAAVIASDKVAAEILAAAPLATEVGEVSELFEALAALADPDLAKQAMALLLDSRVDLKEAGDLLLGLASTPAIQPTAEAWLRDNVDALLARMPGETAPELVDVVIASCDATRRADAQTWAEAHLAGLPGGVRVVAQALERMDQCIAHKAAVGPELDAWLEARD